MGTLVELAAPVDALRAQLASRFGLEISADQAAAALGREIRHYRAHMHEGRDTASLAALRRDCARALRAGLPDGDGVRALDLDELTVALLAALRFAVHGDGRAVLLRARAAGLRVIAVSNWDVSLGEVLEGLGLAPLLWAVVSSAAVGAAKPAPAIFQHALELAGVPAACALHVGDSLTEDVRGAQACGIEAVLLRRPPAPPPSPEALGVRQITSLDELSFAAG
jgi:putative hydrolase of the HAD superfamily